MRVPRIDPRWLPLVVGGEGGFVLADNDHKLLEGILFERVLPQIDGRSSVADIARRLDGEFSSAEVCYALKLLERRGLLAEADGAADPGPDDALWSMLGIVGPDPVRRVGAPTVSLRSVGDASVEPLRAALAAAGVRDGDGGLTVIVTDDLLCAELAAANRAALAQAAPWLLVRPTGRFVSVGPLFVPGRTGCWECLAVRMRAQREPERIAGRYVSGDFIPLPRATTDATRRIAIGMAVAKIAEWVARGGALPALEGRIVTFDMLRFETGWHTLVRLPFCAACGAANPPRERSCDPIEIDRRPKLFTADGGHRSATPEETLDRYGHHVSPLTGIAASLERHDLGDAGAVYVAGYNKVLENNTLCDLRLHFRSRSSGKGITDAQARAGALCESIERYCGHFQGHEPRRRATFRQLGDAAIDPRSCMLYSARQYEEREQWNARPSRFNGVPLRFDDDLEVEWSPIWSLSRRQTRWLPTAWLYFGYPQAPEQCRFLACSNGNAAGNSREEAIMHGFLELIERDALAIWWYNRLFRPGLDLDSFDEPLIRRMRARLCERERDLWALDLTCDTGIPVFGAFSRSLRGNGQSIAMGFGAHVEPRIAMLRAVTELNQMLIWLPPACGTRSEGAFRDPEIVAWMQDASLENEAYLAPCGTRVAADFHYQALDDLHDDLEAFLRLVERLGLEMLVLDQTRPEVGMPVVKVVVPGLRPAHARLAPGRLYDVPVMMGWLGAMQDEAELNPRAVFL
jgi:bacteriocin biosynthesis cyclodehydratase domain-containing protein